MAMTTPRTDRKKRRLPKDIAVRSDHEIMERVFGKRAMREIDALAEGRAGDKKGRKPITK